MATRKFTQNNFTQGQVGPYLAGRGDTPIYKSGLETCENFLCLPQGGLTKRKGFQFVSANPDTSTPSPADSAQPMVTTGFYHKSRMFPFVFADGQEFIILMEPGYESVAAKLHIFYNDTRIATITDGVNGNTFPIQDEDIDDVRYAQSFDYMIFVHRDIRPMELIRGSTNSDWTLTYINFDHLPQDNFNFDTTLTPAAVTGSGINFTLAGGTYRWVDAAWPNGHVNMRVDVNGGKGIITSITSDTVAVVSIEYDLVDTETANGHEWKIDAYSNLSASLGGGWPRSVSFHQNRLIFGGTRDKPQTIYGSQSGDFFNFDNYTRVVSSTGAVTGEITDTSSLQFTIASDQLNIINHVVSQQSLFIFTTDGEFDMSGEPVTPSNALVRQQTRYGVERGRTRPVVVDNEVLFVQRGGSVVRAFVYNFNTDAYSAKNYNLVHHDILTQATTLAYVKNYDDTNNNFVFALNSDGSLSVLGVNSEYTVVGWTKWNTLGLFKDLCVIDDSLYTLVQRYSADGSTLNTTLFLEKLTEEDVYLDAFHSSNVNGQVFQGAQGLQNKTVQVVADGLIHPDITITTEGNFALSRVVDSVAVGHAYDSTAVTLPLQIASANVTTLGERVRKVSAELQFYNTKHLKIDGYNIPFREVGGTLLNASVTPFNGIKRMRLTGYNKQPKVTLLSDLPLPITLLSLTTEIKFGTGKIQDAG
jgi:hypothetical protein